MLKIYYILCFLQVEKIIETLDSSIQKVKSNRFDIIFAFRDIIPALEVNSVSVNKC